MKEKLLVLVRTLGWVKVKVRQGYFRFDVWPVLGGTITQYTSATTLAGVEMTLDNLGKIRYSLDQLTKMPLITFKGFSPSMVDVGLDGTTVIVVKRLRIEVNTFDNHDLMIVVHPVSNTDSYIQFAISSDPKVIEP